MALCFLDCILKQTAFNMCILKVGCYYGFQGPTTSLNDSEVLCICEMIR